MDSTSVEQEAQNHGKNHLHEENKVREWLLGLFSTTSKVREETLKKTCGGDWICESFSLETCLSRYLALGFILCRMKNDVQILCGLVTTGFQATQFGQAVEEINKMLSWSPSVDQVISGEFPKNSRCFIWLSSTSNLMYTGLREIFVYLARFQMFDVFVTTAGAIEADLIKCLAPVYVSQLSQTAVDTKKFKKIGNLLVSDTNLNYLCDWMKPVVEKVLNLQQTQHVHWTPSKLIDFLGKEINHPESFLYWCHKNKIPIFCPGLTDGILGILLLRHSIGQSSQITLDVVEDIRRINDLALYCKKSGIIILGGGSAKHHTCNANLMRNGADFAVYINTAHEFDGSDSGASPDEAVAWGKIRVEATPIKLCCDATIAFPLLVALTFAKYCSRSGEF